MFRNVRAKFAVTVDLPTPPLPEATAMILPTLTVVLSLLGCGAFASPSLITTVIFSFAAGNESLSVCSVRLLIRMANGSRLLGKIKTTTILSSRAVTLCTIPLSTMFF